MAMVVMIVKIPLYGKGVSERSEGPISLPVLHVANCHFRTWRNGSYETYLASNRVVYVGFFPCAETAVDLSEEALVEKLEQDHPSARIHHLKDHIKKKAQRGINLRPGLEASCSVF